MTSTQQEQDHADELHQNAYPDVPERLPEHDWYGELKGLIENHAPQRDLRKGDFSCFRVRGPFTFPTGATTGVTVWALTYSVRNPDGVFLVTYEVIKGPRDEE